ncbi:transglycosylase domain-containing protein [Streptomyces cavernicola]|uniref:Transglycosylase domain-containing protein n=1 Tax=Streptomyces cavernicola TaxID=3043613 RepID=A0ABT6SIG4_9ACTN|nr:transglycosylase domain-containing protein [Streptomyces sp. B-S-A6]MDI3407968.1 transglycosylase domain-containing protein [Streptomyces sp. B-S-A6]
MSDESDEPQPQPQQPAEGSRRQLKKLTRKQRKAARKAKRKASGWRRIFPTWRMLLGAFLLLCLLFGGGLVAGYLLVEIPPANAAATKQSNVYLYADGSPLARDGEVNRENVPLSQIPVHVRRAVLAAEDRDFYSESAVDPQAMIRAAWNTVTGKGKQSGSTITQQFVKNYYLGQEQTVTRKAKEFFIAIKLDRQVSKNDILLGYLNTSYFGRNAYGIQAAAHAYYGKHAEQLSVAEGAYLATLLNSPNAYDVSAHPENKSRAVARWNYVLDGMVKEDWLTRRARDSAKFPAPRTAKAPSGMSGQRGYLVKAVEDYLTEHDVIDPDTLAKGGYRITTTLQKPRQDAFVRAVEDQLLSQVDPGARKVDAHVRAGGAAIDPATGKVVAMYGGIDYTQQYVNNATRRDYQVGSTFKPFVFTSAVRYGATTQDGLPIDPNTLYDGTNARSVEGWSGGHYAPENEDRRSYGELTVRDATDLSVNAVYAQMAVDVGSDKVRQTAIDLGIPATTPDLTASPSIALGPATASVLDMAQAYATLANHGEHGSYTLVEEITKDGAPIALPPQHRRQAVPREAADTTTSILQSVVENGTGTAAQAAGRPAAGKTGTAEEDKAAWFAGYTPELATVVAVLGQDPNPPYGQTPLYGALGQPRINGGAYPARIWAQFTRETLADQPVQEFDLILEPGAEEPPPPPPETEPEPESPAESVPPSVPEPEPTAGGSEEPGATPGRTAVPTEAPVESPAETPAEGDAQGLTAGDDGRPRRAVPTKPAR